MIVVEHEGEIAWGNVDEDTVRINVAGSSAQGWVKRATLAQRGWFVFIGDLPVGHFELFTTACVACGWHIRNADALHP